MAAVLAIGVLVGPGEARAARGLKDNCRKGERLAAAAAVKGVLGCHAQAAKKGSEVDGACLDRARARLAKQLAKAARKAARRAGCPAAAEADAIWNGVAGFAGEVRTTLGIAAGAARSMCAAKQLKAVGAAAERLLVAKAKTGLPPSTRPLERARAQSAGRLGTQLTRAARRPECTANVTVGLVDRISRFAGLSGPVSGRVRAVKRIAVPEAARAGALANRAEFEGRGLTVASDGSAVEGITSPASGWLVELGGVRARTRLDGTFEMNLPLDGPLTGSIFHPGSEGFEVGPISLADLGGAADEPNDVLFEITSQGSCGMNVDPADDPPHCQGGSAAAGVAAGEAAELRALGVLNPDPAAFPPLIEEELGSYPNPDPAAAQVVCLDYNGWVQTGARDPIAYPGSTCFDRVQIGCCDNENADIRRRLNQIARNNIPGLDPRRFPGPVGCITNHGGRRLCQQLRPGDVAVDVPGAIVRAGGRGTVDVRPGETVTLFVHNNGCYGRTNVLREATSVPLGGQLTGQFLSNNTITHFFGSEPGYVPDEVVDYTAPAECPEAGDPATDVFVFEADGARAALEFRCGPATCTDAPTTVELDFGNGEDDPTVEGPVLQEGIDYLITVSGTFSIWTGEWNNGECKGEAGSGVGGPTGIDAHYFFAIPRGSSLCRDSFECCPHHTGFFQIALDGDDFDDPDAIDHDYNPAHVYEHRVTGLGKAVRFRLEEDNARGDDYGVLEIRVECADGAGGTPGPGVTTTIPLPTTTSTSSTSTTSTSTTSTSSSTSTSTSTSTTTSTSLPAGGARDYRLYAATGVDGPSVTLDDSLRSETVDLGLVSRFLVPVSLGGSLVTDADAYQTCHDHPGAPFSGSATVANVFGGATVTVGDPDALCVPENGLLGVDAYNCYEASGAPVAQTFFLDDAFTAESVTIGAPLLLCTPVSTGSGTVNPVGHLVCYETPTTASAVGAVQVDNEFGQSTVTAGLPVGLCVPTTVGSITATP